jgi:hypothetical protein
MLAQAEIDALDQRGIDLPAPRHQNLSDSRDRADHHPVRDSNQTPTPCGLAYLRRE